MRNGHGEVAVEVIDLKKYYGEVKAVDGVSFTASGARCLPLGP